MTRHERRIAELAAQDLEGWALELPLGSETRRDLQQTAQAYRFAGRAGAGDLRAVPEARGPEDQTTHAHRAMSGPGADRALDGPGLADVPREIHSRMDRGA